MNKKKRFVGVGLAVLSSVILAACSSTASNTKVYSYVYSNDPDSLDYVVANRATTSDVTGNLIDGLLENDKYGNLIPSLAEDWTVSKDGLTYTYKLRKDAKWYTSDGEEYAEVKAQDFVTGLKHAADGKSEALYLVQNSIKGLDAYIKGETKDFLLGDDIKKEFELQEYIENEYNRLCTESISILKGNYSVSSSSSKSIDCFSEWVNIQNIIKPQTGFETEIYTDIPKTLENEIILTKDMDR